MWGKTRNTTRLKCCACHAKWRWTRPKCCACHENCNASSENVAKVLRLPHKMIFDTLQNTSECHEVPRLPRETQKLPLLENLPEARPYSNRADGCEWLWTVGQWEPLLRIRERKGKEGNGRDRKGKEGKGRERKGQEGKGRQRNWKTGKERKERERKGKKGKERERKGKDGKGRERKGEVDLEISRRRMTVLKWACLAIAHCHTQCFRAELKKWNLQWMRP